MCTARGYPWTLLAPARIFSSSYVKCLDLKSRLQSFVWNEIQAELCRVHLKWEKKNTDVAIAIFRLEWEVCCAEYVENGIKTEWLTMRPWAVLKADRSTVELKDILDHDLRFFFIFDGSPTDWSMDQRTNQTIVRTDWLTGEPSYRDARTHL